MKDRKTGTVKAQYVANTQAETLLPIIKMSIEENSIVVTDECHSYSKVGETFSHGKVCHSTK